MTNGWRRPFDIPIDLPDGRELVTLRDAGVYISALPKKVQDRPEWQAAAEALILVVERGGPVMLAAIGNPGAPSTRASQRRSRVGSARRSTN